jgi:transposase
MRIKTDRIKESREEIQRLIKRTREARVLPKLQMLMMLKENKSLVQISETLNINYNTLMSWWQKYKKGGIDSIAKLHYKGRKSYLTDKQLLEFREKAEKDGFSNLKEMVNWIKSRYDIEYSIKTVSQLAQKLNIKKRGEKFIYQKRIK